MFESFHLESRRAVYAREQMGEEGFWKRSWREWLTYFGAVAILCTVLPTSEDRGIVVMEWLAEAGVLLIAIPLAERGYHYATAEYFLMKRRLIELEAEVLRSNADKQQDSTNRNILSQLAARTPTSDALETDSRLDALSEAVEMIQERLRAMSTEPAAISSAPAQSRAVSVQPVEQRETFLNPTALRIPIPHFKNGEILVGIKDRCISRLIVDLTGFFEKTATISLHANGVPSDFVVSVPSGSSGLYEDVSGRATFIGDSGRIVDLVAVVNTDGKEYASTPRRVVL